MDGRKFNKKESVIFTILFLAIFSLSRFGKQLQQHGFLVPVTITVVVLLFGFFAYLIGKNWKRSDDEIMDMESVDQGNLFSGAPKRKITYEERQKYFFASIAFIAISFLRQERFAVPHMIFSGIVLTGGCAFFLPAWIQKRRGKEGQPLFPKAKLQPDQMFYMLFCLLGLGFVIFWIYVVLTKTPFWWFSIPGFIIGAGISRPLVAGLRILFRKEKDPGEKHINRRQDADPWDRPDRKL